MKQTASRTRKAAPQGSNLIGIATTLPEGIIGEYKKYADHYEVPLLTLVASNVWQELMALKDCSWEYLDRMNKMTVSPGEKSVVLHFSEATIEFLNRIADLSRRPLPELIRCLAIEGGEMVGHEFDKHLAENDLLSPDVVYHADAVTEFQRFAKANKLPNAIKDINPWEFYGIDAPTSNNVEGKQAA